MTADELLELLPEDLSDADVATREETAMPPKRGNTTDAKILHLFPEAGRQLVEPDRRAQSKPAKARASAELERRLKLAQWQLANVKCPDSDGPMLGTSEYEAWKHTTFGAR